MNPANVQLEFDRYFQKWLETNQCSIILSSYKSGSVVSISQSKIANDDTPKVLTWINNFDRPTGLFLSNKKLWIAARHQIVETVNLGQTLESNGHFSHCFVPQKIHITGDLDIHDLVATSKGSIYFISSIFNSICTVPSETSKNNFEIYWKPPWISKIVSEDRCHLNGLCLRDDQPRYVTAVSKSDLIGGWRDNRIKSGLIYDIVEDKVVCQQLSMPHSPRWYQNRLWVLNSGTGYFGYVEHQTFIPKTFIPGFIRGLNFIGQWAVIGSSIDRHENCFTGLPLGDKLNVEKSEAKCGVFIVNIETFSICHSYIFKQGCQEMYDIAIVPNSQRVRLVDLTDEVINTMSYRFLATNQE